MAPKKSIKKVCFLCEEPSEISCSYCDLVYFCNQDHMAVHRPKNVCFPFKVEKRGEIGRVMVATRDIQPLELILYDRSPAFGPKMGSPVVCLKCLKAVKNPDEFPCEKCSWPMCSEDCRTKSANGLHQEECSILRNSKGKIDFSDFETAQNYYRSIAPLRFLLLKRINPKLYQRFVYLMDHNEERKEYDPELWQLYKTFVNKYIREDCEQSETFTDEEIDRSVGLYWTNAFGCSEGNGQAIFPTFSYISHNCVSNCNHVVFPNRHLALQSKIALKEGEEFTINYISPLQGSFRRYTKLRDKWFFKCNCSRCQDPTENGSYFSSLLCQALVEPGLKRCNGVLSLNDIELGNESYWKCNQCSNKIPSEDVLKLENDIGKEIQTMELENSTSQRVEEALRKLGSILHSNHFLLLLLKRHLIVVSSSKFKEMNIEELEATRRTCEEVLEVLNCVDPGYNRDRGVILRHLSEVRKLECREKFKAGLLTPDQFERQVNECMILFGESQKCMSILLKKQ